MPGAEEFLTKPVNRTELWLRVRNLLRLKALGDQLAEQSIMLKSLVEERNTDLRACEQRFREIAVNISDVFFLREVPSSHMARARRSDGPG